MSSATTKAFLKTVGSVSSTWLISLMDRPYTFSPPKCLIRLLSIEIPSTITKLKQFVYEIETREDLQTTIHEIGDGIAEIYKCKINV